jgi:hypothetical protein
VWRKKGRSQSERIYSSADGKPLGKNADIRLKVSRPKRGFDGLSRFQVGEEFDRHDPAMHRSDFRWIVDFEANDLHSGTVGKHGKLLRPRFYLENGVVFTFIRSIPLLKERKESGKRQARILGRVAQVTAAYIYLARGDSPAALIVNGEKIPFASGSKYDVVLRNDCPPGTLIDGDVVDTTELNKTFTPPARQAHFTLLPGIEGPSAERMMDAEVKGLDLGELSLFFGGLLSAGDGEVVPTVTRTHPCGGAFFGSGSLD